MRIAVDPFLPANTLFLTSDGSSVFTANGTNSRRCFACGGELTPVPEARADVCAGCGVVVMEDRGGSESWSAELPTKGLSISDLVAAKRALDADPAVPEPPRTDPPLAPVRPLRYSRSFE